jgi:hypothetical protein
MYLVQISDRTLNILTGVGFLGASDPTSKYQDSNLNYISITNASFHIPSNSLLIQHSIVYMNSVIKYTTGGGKTNKQNKK